MDSERHRGATVLAAIFEQAEDLSRIGLADDAAQKIRSASGDYRKGHAET
jgi:hypothetical protein